ncbi:MAG: TetR/AcrR family transcriptional regulator [Myxococcales bacterium]|nr:TetR/AcrR family transcriptional regulator [Myxococcales bacterium]
MVGTRRTAADNATASNALSPSSAGSSSSLDARSKAVLAATRLFAAHGFDGTSVQDIADDLGVTKQAVLHHFASKEQLREAVLDEILEHWNERLPKLLLAATASEDRFDAVFGELFRFFFAEPNRARVVLREALDRPTIVRRLLEGPVRPWLAAVAGYIQSGVDRGQHHSGLDPEAYVVHVLLLVLSAAAGVHVMPAALGASSSGADAVDRYSKELARLARSALFREPTPPRKTAPPREKPARTTARRKKTPR